MSDALLPGFKATILEHFPDLADSEFSLLTKGWHSIAVDADDRFIFKFPRHEEAERALRTEAGLLAVIRPAVTMPVPDLTLFPGPPLFSHHAKLKGEHLTTKEYTGLPDAAREDLASRMAHLYSELHALDHHSMAAAGATPVHPWPAPEDILRDAWPVLPSELRNPAEQAIDAWQHLAPDPHGTSYGFFDGHGWNMAFDHGSQRLNGVYDFADSGFGPLHQEFIYSNFISWDLTSRIIRAYESLTARTIDRKRVHLLTGVFWLSEVAGFANEPTHLPQALALVSDWARHE